MRPGKVFWVRLHSAVDTRCRKVPEDRDLKKPESKASSNGEEIHRPMGKIYRLVML